MRINPLPHKGHFSPTFTFFTEDFPCDFEVGGAAVGDAEVDEILLDGAFVSDSFNVEIFNKELSDFT